MFTESEILQRLEDGEDPQELIEDIVYKLSNITRRKAEELKKKDAEKARERYEAEKYAQKLNDLRNVLNQLEDWYEKFYDVKHLHFIFEELITVEHVLETIDSITDPSKLITTFGEIFVKEAEKEYVKEALKNSNYIEKDDPISTIEEFLAEMGW